MTGATGVTGATGPTGATGATGAPGVNDYAFSNLLAGNINSDPMPSIPIGDNIIPMDSSSVVQGGNGFSVTPGNYYIQYEVNTSGGDAGFGIYVGGTYYAVINPVSKTSYTYTGIVRIMSSGWVNLQIFDNPMQVNVTSGKLTIIRLGN